MILDGGAVRGAYMGAILAHFYSVGIRADFFDLIVGTSIGGTSATYYVAGQIEEGLRFFTEHMPGKFITKVLGVPFFNMQYLAWAYRESRDKLNAELLRGRTPVYMPVSNSKTGKAEFVCLNNQEDPTWVMLNGVNVPVLGYNTAVLADGSREDGGFMEQPPVRHPFVEKANEIWFLSPFTREYRSSEFKSKIIALFLGAFDPDVRRMVANMASRSNAARNTLDGMADVRVIRPERKLEIGWAHKDVPAIKRVMALGTDDAKRFLDSKSMKP
ncbi:MAG: hypothetical protein HZA95_00870 [Candidatus Vogelbacteria bacterium]|nr:hypothetical protein [Candidatus Vogelbacteria bacterium]